MLEIIISEKGGAEKRQSFDTDEITVGRIQGNDITLPKGNVSKQHARLNLRDGVYYVTDQNSTNGTYVNRKRVTVPTAVGAGDRIYVGDYVLTIGGEASAALEDSPLGGEAQPQGRALDQDLVPWPDLDPPAKPVVAAVASLEPPAAEVDAVIESPGLGQKPQPELVDPTPQAAPPQSVLLAVSLPDQAVAISPQELFELGPLGALLSDATVTRIDIDAANSLWISRLGQPARQELPFATPASVRSALERLCARAGVEFSEKQRSVNAALPGGFRLCAVELEGTRVLATLTRAVPVATSLDSLSALGVLTKEAASFLRASTRGRLNILVVGPRPGGMAALACALAQCTAADPWTIVETDSEFAFGAVHVVRLGAAEAEGRELELARLLCARPGGRLLVEDMSGPAAALVVGATLAGMQGVIATAAFATVEQALERLAVIAAIADRSYSLEVAHKALATGFDLAVEVVRLADGRDQVRRICKLQSGAPAQGVELVGVP